MLNSYFQRAPYHGTKNEQDLYEDLIIESIQINGVDVFYIPRVVVYEDDIFREDRFSQYKEAFRIEMYLENYTGFEGEGEFFNKFGLHMPDQARLIVARKRWEEVVGRNASILQLPNRPAEGDLIYFAGDANDILQVKFVEHEEQQFYQLGKLYTYMLKCEKFIYAQNQISTGLEMIDSGYIDNDQILEDIMNIPSLEEMQVGSTEPMKEDVGVTDQPFAKNFDIEKRADSVLVTEEENVFGKVGGKSPGRKRRKL